MGVFLAVPLHASAPQSVTIAQLRQLLLQQRAHHARDEKVANFAAHLQLSESLSEDAYDRLIAELKPGAQTVQALEFIADRSTFMPPPADTLLGQPVPDADQRKHLGTALGNFALVTMHRLPNFLVARVTHTYNDIQTISTLGESISLPTGTLHPAGTYKEIITYRDGEEVLASDPRRKSFWHSAQLRPFGLTSSGEFGPALIMVLTDSARGSLNWQHWVKTDTGLEAVLVYRVPKPASHFGIGLCWSQDPTLGSQPGTGGYCGTPAYHGLLIVDPATGTVRRLTIEASFEPSDHVKRAAISITYGPVDIGGNTYICPLRSVAIYSTTLLTSPRQLPILNLNEVHFTNYHRFGSTVQILTGPPPQ